MVAITGASGAIYARRLLEVLPGECSRVYLTASDNAVGIMNQELGIQNLSQLISPDDIEKVKIFDSSDLFAPPASGSHEYDAMIVIPCSMGVVGRIASGVSTDLITRAADVCLKERRKLILVIRETPMSLIHLRNLTILAEASAIILPACPAFYQKPNTIDDTVDFVVDRVLRCLGAQTRLIESWGE